MSTLSESWSQQRARVGRWLDRVRAIHRGERTDLTTHALEDEVRAFFVECWHLGEYLYKTEARLFSQPDVESWRDTHRALATCHKLCNGIKHVYRLADDDPRLAQQALLLSIKDGTAGAPQFSTHGVRMAIHPGGEDALQVAEQAVADWDEFIRARTKR